MQGFDLRFAQDAPVAGLQTAELQRAEPGAPQRLHLVANGVQHPAHLAVAALPDDHSQLGVARTQGRIEARDLHLGRRGLAVIEVDAIPQRIEVSRARASGDNRCPESPSSPTASRTVVREASSFAVVITPTGLLSIR